MHREENRQPPKHAVDPPPSRGLHRRNSTYGARYAKSSHHPARQQHNMSYSEYKKHTTKNGVAVKQTKGAVNTQNGKVVAGKKTKVVGGKVVYDSDSDSSLRVLR